MNEITINYEFLSLEELSAVEQELVRAAINATSRSYAKYSNFCVGAALRLNDGTIVLGANQENASYPLGLCAERTALFAAQVDKPDQAVSCLAISARNTLGITHTPISPCGSCRQVMVEVEQRYGTPMTVLLYGVKGVYRFHSAQDLLPLSFVGEELKS